jgi:hypothetical protein
MWQGSDEFSLLKIGNKTLTGAGVDACRLV